MYAFNNRCCQAFIQQLYTLKLVLFLFLFAISAQLMSQTANDLESMLTLSVEVADQHVTISPKVVNLTSDTLAATCSMTVERIGGTGNRSRSAQSGAVSLAPQAKQVMGVSTINFSPGDRLVIFSELRDRAGELLATVQEERAL